MDGIGGVGMWIKLFINILPGKKHIALTSIDCLDGTSFGALVSSNAVWKQRRPVYKCKQIGTLKT